LHGTVRHAALYPLSVRLSDPHIDAIEDTRGTVMKSIHAISTILAVWGTGSPGAIAKQPFCPAQVTRFDDRGMMKRPRELDGRATLQQSALGMPSLLASALLQGGSGTDRRFR
jgi:hypothetical protein